MAGLELSIIQDDCTSCGLCEEITNRHFFIANDGLAYVKEATPGTPNEIRHMGYGGKIAVASELEALVIEAAEECPGECIYVEPVTALI